MSYDVYIYHRDVKEHVDRGQELDEFEHTPISADDMKRFIDRLLTYGYRLESKNLSCEEYIKEIAGCPVQVAVFHSEIAFSIPYWPNAETAIAEAVQDATELSDSETTVFYDPQTGSWVE